jgi:nicotinamidase-related amidase
MQNKALVVIDIQNDITKNYKEIIDNINTAADWAVAESIHVVYIKHNNLSAGTRTFKPAHKSAELVPDMKIVSENIFTKTKGNALTSEEFASFIKENEITEFYIAGADAIACVKSTCYNMSKEGYIVHALSDCITSYDKRKIDEMLQYMRARALGRKAERSNAVNNA